MKDVIKLILIDIEGTTAPITFVKEVLFPYAYRRLEEFVKDNLQNQAVLNCIKDTLKTIRTELNIRLPEDDTETAIKQLLNWITEDRKHPALKQLQGMIWKTGYEEGVLKSHLYPDVLPQINLWKSAGYILAVYSSGSVEAQKLFYQHTDEGDVSSLWNAWYDTAVGSKKEPSSYQNICRLQENILPQEVLFLSDVEEELTAAQSAGMKVIHIVREGTIPSTVFPTVKTFDEIDLNQL